ncbi:MAG TPA: hypothetical protein PLH57_03745, partial [Oligoflexia bacterium]|nr:hypothetical protein [Oligoflexia bacterium]
MKKNLLNQAINLAFVYLIAICCAPNVRAAENTDLNAMFAFKKVFVASPKDNVDGAYVQPVSEAFADIFEKNLRFELVDDIDIADTVVESSIEKKVSGTDLEIKLLLQPSKEVFVVERASLPAASSGGELVNQLKQLLKTALKRIPFYGTVTGRDADMVTLDIGSIQGLLEGDIVQVSRVERVKRHPLLKTIVDVELVPVGSVEITEIEDSVAFGKVHKTLTGEGILRLHKVTAIESRMPKERENKD